MTITLIVRCFVMCTTIKTGGNEVTRSGRSRTNPFTDLSKLAEERQFQMKLESNGGNTISECQGFGVEEVQFSKSRVELLMAGFCLASVSPFLAANTFVTHVAVKFLTCAKGMREI